jgi:hypothetical protein
MQHISFRVMSIRAASNGRSKPGHEDEAGGLPCHIRFDASYDSLPISLGQRLQRA